MASPGGEDCCMEGEGASKVDTCRGSAAAPGSRAGGRGPLYPALYCWGARMGRVSSDGSACKGGCGEGCRALGRGTGAGGVAWVGAATAAAGATEGACPMAGPPTGAWLGTCCDGATVADDGAGAWAGTNTGPCTVRSIAGGG